MVIDKGKFIALLVEQAGFEKAEAKEQLEKLTERIQLVAETGEPFEIEGLGTFYQEKEELCFEAAPRLEIEINQKYSGMKPIELMAAFKKSGAGVPVEKTEPAKPPAPPKKTEETPPETPAQEDHPQDEPVKEPAATVSDQEQAEKTSAEEKSSEKTPALAAKAEAEPREKEKKQSKEENDPIGTILVAAVCVIVILVGAWLLYTNGVFNFNSSKSDQAQTNVMQPLAVQNNSTQRAQAGSNGTQADSTGATESARQDSVTTAPAYGLKGQVNPKAQNGYTIVIHSFRQEATVREIKKGLVKKGYRVLLIEEDNRWRVGLGRFKTEDKAREVAQSLPEPYKSNHFVIRM